MGTIGKRLKEFALKNEHTVKEFEIKANLSIGTIARESNIRVDNLAKILEIYPDLDVKWVLTGIKSIVSEHIDKVPQIKEKLTESEEYLKTIIKSQQAMIKAQQDTINTMMSMKGL